MYTQGLPDKVTIIQPGLTMPAMVALAEILKLRNQYQILQF
jgi:hypothetical protein